MTHADVEYLEAKRSVDDRALAPQVSDRLFAELPAAPRILEAGAGTGVSIPRLLAGGVTAGSYRGVDRSGAVLSHARDRRMAELDADRTDGGFRVRDLTVRFERGDALDAFAGERADLLIAQSFLDLVPVDRAIELFEEALVAGGLLYAPLTFDGTTIFQPDHPADEAVISAYHDHIAAQPGRDPHAGRHVLESLRRRDGRVLAVASSDWIVRPTDGEYPAAEASFLEAILDFVATGTASVSAADDWCSDRRDQLAAGELSYIAHQYDFLYRTAPK